MGPVEKTVFALEVLGGYLKISQAYQALCIRKYTI